jgi:hypothetical protein
LRRDGPKLLGRGVALRRAAQRRIVALIGVNHLEDVLFAAFAWWRRDQPLQVEHVGIDQQVHQRLKIVRVRPADVGRDDHPRPLSRQGAARRRFKIVGQGASAEGCQQHDKRSQPGTGQPPESTWLSVMASLVAASSGSRHDLGHCFTRRGLDVDASFFRGRRQ